MTIETRTVLGLPTKKELDQIRIRKSLPSQFVSEGKILYPSEGGNHIFELVGIDGILLRINRREGQDEALSMDTAALIVWLQESDPAFKEFFPVVEHFLKAVLTDQHTENPQRIELFPFTHTQGQATVAVERLRDPQWKIGVEFLNEQGLRSIAHPERISTDKVRLDVLNILRVVRLAIEGQIMLDKYGLVPDDIKTSYAVRMDKGGRAVGYKILDIEKLREYDPTLRDRMTKNHLYVYITNLPKVSPQEFLEPIDLFHSIAGQKLLLLDLLLRVSSKSETVITQICGDWNERLKRSLKPKDLHLTLRQIAAIAHSMIQEIETPSMEDKTGCISLENYVYLRDRLDEYQKAEIAVKRRPV